MKIMFMVLSYLSLSMVLVVAALQFMNMMYSRIAYAVMIIFTLSWSLSVLSWVICTRKTKALRKA